MKSLISLLLLSLSAAVYAQHDCFSQKVFDLADYMAKGYDTILKESDIYTQSFVGCSMPVWEARDRQGRTISPYDYQGRIVFLNFWWPGCVPCIHEFHSLNKLAEEYGDRVLFLSFVSGRRGQMDSVLQKYPLAMRLLPEADSLTREVFRMSVFPTNMIVGRDGRVAAIMHGGQSDDGLGNYEKLKPMIERVLQQRQ